MNPAIGTMVCPLSVIAKRPHQATIHQQNSKRQPYYYRCDCGTMQPLTETGQALMAAVMQPIKRENPGKDAADIESGDSDNPKDEGTESPAAKGSAVKDFFFGGDDDG